MLRSLCLPILFSFATMAHAEIQSVKVENIQFRDANLTVLGSGGEVSYSPEVLEKMGTYKITTKTPWRESPAEFVGVRLVDVLTAHNIDSAASIKVTAENGYAVEIPSSVWKEHSPLIATRVDGKAHSRRNRGPLQIVFPMDEDVSTAESTFEDNWVWMAARIEPLQN